MLQDENIIVNNRVLEIKDNIAKIDSSIKKLDKCINVCKQEGISDTCLILLEKRILDLQESKNRLQGELQHICNKCVHDFIKIGTRQTLFGLEEIYQCNKCGYQTGKFEENI